jgi:hypothetical protein
VNVQAAECDKLAVVSVRMSDAHHSPSLLSVSRRLSRDGQVASTRFFRCVQERERRGDERLFRANLLEHFFEERTWTLAQSEE